MKSTVLAALAAAFATTAIAQAPAPVPETPAAAPKAADWRTIDPDLLLVIDTNKGRILVELVPEAAPAHVQRIQELARAHFYDGLTFFRVIEGFMDQTGDPQNTGIGGSDKPDLAAEFSFWRAPETPFVTLQDDMVAESGFIRSLTVTSQSMNLAPFMNGRVRGWALYCPGVAAMARAEDPNSANSQFFLMRDRYPRLETRYTAWGRVVSGQAAVLAIKVGEPVADPQDKMERVRLASDLPEAQRPKVRVIDPRSAWLKAEVVRVKAVKGTEFSVCDVNIPAEVK